MPLTQEQIPFPSATIRTHLPHPLSLPRRKMVGFQGMDVLEVDGILPRQLVMDILGANRWVSLEAMRYWDELGAGGGGTRPPEGLSHKIQDVNSFSNRHPTPFRRAWSKTCPRAWKTRLIAFSQSPASSTSTPSASPWKKCTPHSNPAGNSSPCSRQSSPLTTGTISPT